MRRERPASPQLLQCLSQKRKALCTQLKPKHIVVQFVFPCQARNRLCGNNFLDLLGAFLQSWKVYESKNLLGTDRDSLTNPYVMNSLCQWCQGIFIYLPEFLFCDFGKTGNIEIFCTKTVLALRVCTCLVAFAWIGIWMQK